MFSKLRIQVLLLFFFFFFASWSPKKRFILGLIWAQIFCSYCVCWVCLCASAFNPKNICTLWFAILSLVRHFLLLLLSTFSPFTTISLGQCFGLKVGIFLSSHALCQMIKPDLIQVWIKIERTHTHTQYLKSVLNLPGFVEKTDQIVCNCLMLWFHLVWLCLRESVFLLLLLVLGIGLGINFFF